MSELILHIKKMVYPLLLILMIGTTWLNSVKIQAFGLNSNPLLIPALFFGLIVIFDWLYRTFVGLPEDRRILLIPAILGIVPLVEEEPRLLRLPRLLYMVFVISSFVSILNGYSLNTDFLVRLLIFTLLMVVIPTHPEFRRSAYITLGIRTVFVLTSLTGLFSLYALIFDAQHIVGTTVIGVWDKGVSGLYVNSNQGAIVSALGLFAALYLLRTEKHKSARAVAAILALIQVVALVFSNSRTIFLSLFLALAGYFFLNVINRKTIDKTILAMIVGVLVLQLVIQPYVEEHHLTAGNLTPRSLDFSDLEDLDDEQSITGKKSDIPWFYFEGPVPMSEVYLHSSTLRMINKLLSSRVQLAKETILLWRTKPIAGYGFQSLYEVFVQEVGPYGYLADRHLASSHNVFLDILWMGGIVGLGLGLALFSIILIGIIQMWRRQERIDLKLYFYTLLFLFFMVNQMLEVSAVTAFNLNTLSFWVLLPGFATWNHTKSKQRESVILEVECSAKA